MPAASPTVIVQLSDIHISGRHGYFYENWRRVLKEVDAIEPDAVVVSGDLTINGVEDEADLVFARRELDRLPEPWWALPGNHDVGEEPDALHVGQPVDVEGWRGDVSPCGPEWWEADVAGWRLIGLDSQILGSGLVAGAEQLDGLAGVLGRDGRPVGVFPHKPLYVEDPAAEP